MKQLDLSVSLSFAKSSARLISFTPCLVCYAEPFDPRHHCSVLALPFFSPSPHSLLSLICDSLCLYSIVRGFLPAESKAAKAAHAGAFH